jgi:micrococcal nuclease
MICSLVFTAVVTGVVVTMADAPAAQVPAPRTLAGTITHIADGDTLEVTVGPRMWRVRLEGIDAPEQGQAFGRQASLRLRLLAFDQPARMEVRDTDQYGRLVARVYVGDRDLSEEMVAAGFAWHYRQSSRDARLAALEQQARAARRGLWADKAPTPPWEFRALERGGRPPAPLRAPPRAAVSGPYHGNVRSHVYHAAGCPDYNCKRCTAVFATRRDAEAAGYRADAQCVR